MSGKLIITFGEPPKTFVKQVKYTLLNGSEIKFDVTYKFRTRSQYGELMDEIASEAKAKLPTKLGEKPVALKDTLVNGGKSDVEAVLKFAEGWSLNDAFTAANLLFVDDNYPGVLLAINDAYRDAVLNGHIKN